MSATDAKPTQAEPSGTLTAEKVRELMEDNSRQYPSPTDPYVWLTEYDWQAIADELNATLGSSSCTNDCTNGERTDAPSLPYWWTHDGTLHIELPKLPESIQVRLPDQRDREVGSARVWQYTLGAETCRMEYCDEWSGDELYPTEAYVCSACGEMTVEGKPDYCPFCGRKVVGE